MSCSIFSSPIAGVCLQFLPNARPSISRREVNFFTIQPQPSYIYTGRSGWYPQGEVTDYATATLVLRVPENFSTIASGSLDQGYPKMVLSGGSERTKHDVEGVPVQRDAAGAISRLGHESIRPCRFVIVLHHAAGR